MKMFEPISRPIGSRRAMTAGMGRLSEATGANAPAADQPRKSKPCGDGRH
jgi:hypothetical protein